MQSECRVILLRELFVMTEITLIILGNEVQWNESKIYNIEDSLLLFSFVDIINFHGEDIIFLISGNDIWSQWLRIVESIHKPLEFFW